MAAASEKSRAELIRAGVQLILQQSPPRTFHSMGKGNSSGESHPRRWLGELYEKALRRR
jgi:hypothetical protein